MSFWEKIAEKSKNWFKICYLFTKKLLFFIWQWMILCNKGTSINDVSSNFGFLDPLPPPVALLLALQITSKFHFYYPPPPQRRHCLWMVPKNSSDTKVRLMNYLHFSKILSILSDTFDHFLEKKKLQFWHISSTVRADLPKKDFHYGRSAWTPRRQTLFWPHMWWIFSSKTFVSVDAVKIL